MLRPPGAPAFPARPPGSFARATASFGARVDPGKAQKKQSLLPRPPRDDAPATKGRARARPRRAPPDPLIPSRLSRPSPVRSFACCAAWTSEPAARARAATGARPVAPRRRSCLARRPRTTPRPRARSRAGTAPPRPLPARRRRSSSGRRARALRGRLVHVRGRGGADDALGAPRAERRARDRLRRGGRPPRRRDRPPALPRALPSRPHRGGHQRNRSEPARASPRARGGARPRLGRDGAWRGRAALRMHRSATAADGGFGAFADPPGDPFHRGLANPAAGLALGIPSGGDGHGGGKAFESGAPGPGGRTGRRRRAGGGGGGDGRGVRSGRRRSLGRVAAFGATPPREEPERRAERGRG